MGTTPTIAVMQPYFFPYAGYYRLLAAADIFVIFDCVQFPRRGWVHRNRLHDADGDMDWLTLPLAKSDYHVRIADLHFQPDAPVEMQKRIRRFPALFSTPEDDFLAAVKNCSGTVTDYLEHTIRLTLGRLNITPPRIMRSSQLNAPPELHAADRILWLVKTLGGGTYINAPGGRTIYSQEQFTAADVKLRFLKPYNGSMISMLERQLTEPADHLREEISRQCILEI